MGCDRRPAAWQPPAFRRGVHQQGATPGNDAHLRAPSNRRGGFAPGLRPAAV